MMEITYKQLTTSDLALFRKLNHMFGEAFEDPQAYHAAAPSDAYLQTLLAKRDFIAVVALDNDIVAGGLAAYVLQKFEQERSEIYIYDLAVRDEYRRKRVATTLIETLRTIAKDLGAYVIYVQADKGDDPAIKLYESLGTKEDVFHFDFDVK